MRMVVGLDIKHGATIALACGSALALGLAITSNDSRGPSAAKGSRWW
jgi:hypothetical protein